MQIMTLNKDFAPCGQAMLRYIDLTWHRKYYETGQFKIQILSRDYIKDMAYIYTKDRPELGIVQKIEYSEDSQKMIISGYFLEKILADKIIYPTFDMYGTRTKFVLEAVKKFKGDIPNLEIGTILDDSKEEKIQKQETGSCLDKVAHETLAIEQKAYKLRYDYLKDKAYFDIWQGVDRTQSQSKNNFVIFSRNFKNIKEVKATSDTSNYKNYFVIAGTGEGEQRIIETLDLSNGGYKKEVFIDARNEKFDKEKQTLEEYKKTLVQKGIEKSKDYAEIENIEFDTINNRKSFEYMKDFDLGDKCDIVISNLRKSYESRIIEVLETWNSNEHRITLTFGNKIPTFFEKVRLQ